MRVRDRLIAAVVAAVVVVGGFWILLVSPERHRVSDLQSQIDSERSSLATAESSLAAARRTAAGYAGDVRADAQVLAAVPPQLSEPELVALMTRLAGTRVDVQAINVGTTGATADGTTSLGVTFTFNATYGSLQSLISGLDSLTATDGTNLSAKGRLVKIDSVTLQPKPPLSTQATVIAEVYSQTPTSVAATGATGATGATATSTTSAVTP